MRIFTKKPFDAGKVPQVLAGGSGAMAISSAVSFYTDRKVAGFSLALSSMITGALSAYSYVIKKVVQRVDIEDIEESTSVTVGDSADISIILSDISEEEHDEVTNRSWEESIEMPRARPGSARTI